MSLAGLERDRQPWRRRNGDCNLHQRLPASRTLQDQQRATRPSALHLRPWTSEARTDCSWHCSLRRKRRGIAKLPKPNLSICGCINLERKNKVIPCSVSCHSYSSAEPFKWWINMWMYCTVLLIRVVDQATGSNPVMIFLAV